MAERKRVRYPGTNVWVEYKDENTCPNTPNSLRGQSRPPDSPIGDLELSATGEASPPPLLYSRKPVLRRKGEAPLATATNEELLTRLDNMLLQLDVGRNDQESSFTGLRSAGHTSNTKGASKRSEEFKCDPDHQGCFDPTQGASLRSRALRSNLKTSIATQTPSEEVGAGSTLGGAVSEACSKKQSKPFMREVLQPRLKGFMEEDVGEITKLTPTLPQGTSKRSEDFKCDRDKPGCFDPTQGASLRSRALRSNLKTSIATQTPSGEVGAGSALGGGVSETCSKKQSKPFMRKVLQPRLKGFMQDDVGEFKSFIAGACNTSTPRCSATQQKRKDFKKEGAGDFESFIAGATNSSTPRCSKTKQRTGDPAPTEKTEL